MESKLTLKLDSDAIGRAKRYIHGNNGTSLSKLVENYFNSLTMKQGVSKFNKLPPIVSGLAGIAKKGNSTTANLKDDYAEYLTKKYK
jgi:hypothetical protein